MNMMNFWKQDKKNTIWIIFFSVILVSCLKDIVNYVVEYVFLPYENVIVITSSPEIGIFADEENMAYFNRLGLNASVGEINDTQYVDGLNYYNVNILKSPTVYISTLSSEGQITVLLNGELEQECFIFDNGRILKSYPFSHSKHKIILLVLSYIMLITLIVIVLEVLNYVMFKKRIHNNTIYIKKKSVLFIIVWFLVYAIVLMQYFLHIGLPHYVPDNAYGDQAGYWQSYIFGKKGFDYDFLAGLPVFRGYLCYVLPSTAQLLGGFLNVDPVAVYLLFPSSMVSWLCTILMPEMYTFYSRKKATIFQVAVAVVLFVFFWNDHVVAVMSDLYAAVFFLTSLFFVKKYIDDKTVKNAAFIGICFAATLQFRMQYIIVFLALVLWYLFKGIRNVIKKDHKPERWRHNVVFSKKTICHIAVFVVAFVLICTPQTITNYKRNHIGMFPYDTSDAYAGYPVVWSYWNTFFSYGMVMGPRFVSDGQISTMKTGMGYERYQVLTPEQSMDCYSNNPIDFLVAMIKKLFIGFDKKTNINYGDFALWRNTSGNLFSLINYFIIGTAIFIFVFFLTGKQKEVLSIVFGGAVMPCLQSHCEWRYFLIGYIIFYYLFSFVFLDFLVSGGERFNDLKGKGFLKFVTVFEYASFFISYSLWGAVW